MHSGAMLGQVPLGHEPGSAFTSLSELAFALTAPLVGVVFEAVVHFETLRASLWWDDRYRPYPATTARAALAVKLRTRVMGWLPLCRVIPPLRDASSAAAEFYRRRGGQLSAYCRDCQRAASRESYERRRQDPVELARLRAADRARRRRSRTQAGQAHRLLGGEAA